MKKMKKIKTWPLFCGSGLIQGMSEASVLVRILYKNGEAIVTNYCLPLGSLVAV